MRIHNIFRFQQGIVRDSIKSELDDIVQDCIGSKLPGLIDHFREEIVDEHKLKVCELGEVVQDSVLYVRYEL